MSQISVVEIAGGAISVVEVVRDGVSAVEVTVPNNSISVVEVTIPGLQGPTGPSGASTGSFLDLNDTPDAYLGQANKAVTVKADETGLEFTVGGGYTDEQAQDAVGAMLSGNVETLIAVTYQDATAKIDFVVDNDLSHYSNATSGFLTAATADALFLTPAEGDAAYQPLDADLTSWAGVTRAAGFDTFAATPSSANLSSLLTDEAFSMSDAELGAIAGLVSAADKGIYFTGPGAAATYDLTAYGRTLAGLADETALEALLDTLPNLTSIQSLAVTFADAGFDVLSGWDDSAVAHKNFLLADILTEAGPAAGDYVLIYGAEGDLRKVDWSNVGGGSFPADPGADRLLLWDETDNTIKWLQLANIATEGAPAAGDYVLVQRAEDDVVKVNWNLLPGGGAVTWPQAIDEGAVFTWTDSPAETLLSMEEGDFRLSGNLRFDDGTGIRSSVAGNPALLTFTSIADAVNYLTITNAATGSPPTIASAGTDTDLGFRFAPKGFGRPLFKSSDVANTAGGLDIETGTGTVAFAIELTDGAGGSFAVSAATAADGAFQFRSDGNMSFATDNNAGTTISFLPYNATAAAGATALVLQDNGGATPVNYLTITNAATGNRPKLAVAGTDTDIGMRFLAKGEGTYAFGDGTADVALELFNVAGSATLEASGTSGRFTLDGLSFLCRTGTVSDNITFQNGNLNTLVLSGVASAVNYLTVINAATGSGPIISSEGEAGDIPIILNPKGAVSRVNVVPDTGEVNAAIRVTSGLYASAISIGMFSETATFESANITGFDIGVGGEDQHPPLRVLTNDGLEVILTAQGVASAVNYLTITNAATGTNPLFTAVGTDTDIGMTFRSKGEGIMRFEVPSTGTLNDFNGVARFVVGATGTPLAGFGARFRFSLDNSLNLPTDAAWFGSYWVNPTSGAEISAFRISPTGDNAGLDVLGVASAVNYLTVTNAATGTAGPIIASAGETDVDIRLRPAGTGAVNFTGNVVPNADNTYDIGDATHRIRNLYLASGFSVDEGPIFTWGDSPAETLVAFDGSGLAFGGYIELDEIADPAAPTANKARLFTRDNGSGLTQICAIGPGGTIVPIVTLD